MIHFTKLFSSISIVLLFSSCGSIKPDAPVNEVAELPLLEQPLSSIVVPIKINLSPYFKETENSIPKKFTGKEENCEGVSFSYIFYRDPILFNGQKNALSFEVDGKYSLKINYCPQCTSLFDNQGNCVIPRLYASCGINEPLRKITVGYKTKLNITPDFKLKAETSLQKVEIKDPCEITVFKYDASKTLKEEITKALKDLEKVIDKEIGNVDIKSQALDAWKMLSDPISLGNYGFLYANPSKINLDELKFSGNYAHIELSLGLKPILSTNLIPQKSNPPLPKLSDFTNSEGFNLTMDIKANYDSLSHLITKEINGKEIEIKGKKVIFESIKIHGASNQKINFEIAFSGKKKGILYLTGTPVFNKETQTISFPDIEFDVKTKSALLKSAKWLFNDKITDAIKTNTVFDLTPQIINIKETLNKQINATKIKDITLKGTIKSIQLENIYPSINDLIIRVNSNGAIYLEL
ncbi:MAG: DUF4403 family protein [Flavobacteriia bacterium]|nr:DUF4403 family protein [Flavobacteriia bacterium]